MIPKVIHYCWFGGNNKSEIINRCINSWKKYCPDYKIIEWNEDNIDFSECQYAKEAYLAKKWAFVSDYVRIKVLLDYGGIYIDTDVELIKSLDNLLNDDFFVGFEKELDGNYGVNTGSMVGAVKGHPFLVEQEKEYHLYNFIISDGVYNLTTCVEYTTNLLKKNGLILNNKKQRVMECTIFPSDFFCPLDMNTGRLHLTSNSYSIHHYSGSWAPATENYGYHLKWECIRKYGNCFGKFVYWVKYSFYLIRKDGIINLLKKIETKITKK